MSTPGYQLDPNAALAPSSFDWQRATARNAFNQAMAQLQLRRAQALQQYGFTTDAQGNAAVDTGAMHGTYQDLLGQQGGELDANALAQAGRGLGASGLSQQAEGGLRWSQAGQSAASAQSIQDLLAQIAGQQTGEQANLGQALSGIDLGQAQANAAAQLANPPTPGLPPPSMPGVGGPAGAPFGIGDSARAPWWSGEPGPGTPGFGRPRVVPGTRGGAMAGAARGPMPSWSPRRAGY